MCSVIQTVCNCVETLVAHFHLIAATRDTRVVRGDQNVSRNALSANACARIVHSAEVGRSNISNTESISIQSKVQSTTNASQVVINLKTIFR